MKKLYIVLQYEVGNSWSFREEKWIEKKEQRGGGKEKIPFLNPFMVGAKFTQAFAGKIQEILILWLVVFNSGGRKEGMLHILHLYCFGRIKNTQTIQTWKM